MDRWRQQVLEHAASEETLALAQRTAAQIPEMQGMFREQDLRQLLRGFCQMLEEALNESGDETRRFFLETAVPGLVEAGQAPPTLVRSTATFAVLITVAVLDDIDPADRSEAAEWLAGFFGEYVRDVATAADRREA